MTALRTPPSVPQEFRQLEHDAFGPVADVTCANAVDSSKAIELKKVRRKCCPSVLRPGTSDCAPRARNKRLRTVRA
jgi:hypothetical protein